MTGRGIFSAIHSGLPTTPKVCSAYDFGRMTEARKRSHVVFPNDENGDVLRRMQAVGDDLSRPREIEFTVVFSTGMSADQFAEHFRALGYRVSSEFAETVEDYPWEVVVARQMLPSHAEIGIFEDLLQSIAGPLDGRNDGWGCLSERSASP